LNVFGFNDRERLALYVGLQSLLYAQKKKTIYRFLRTAVEVLT
jgi:hypothetical protein